MASNSKKNDSNGTVKAVCAGAAGAAAGAATYGAIGGVGVAAAGTAVGITLGPFVAIGAGVGLAGYGLYWLGKQVGGSQSKALGNEEESEGKAQLKDKSHD